MAIITFGAIGGFNFFAKQVSAGCAGGELTATDAQNLYNRIQTFMTAVGN